MYVFMKHTICDVSKSSKFDKSFFGLPNHSIINIGL